MRNRAKCKVCNVIIESFAWNDHIACKCGEIEIWGGLQNAKCAANKWENFLRIDDQGNEIVPQIVKNEEEKIDMAIPGEKTRDDLINIFQQLLDSIEKMSEDALLIPVNHVDLHTYLTVIMEIIKKK